MVFLWFTRGLITQDQEDDPVCASVFVAQVAASAETLPTLRRSSRRKKCGCDMLKACSKTTVTNYIIYILIK